MGIIINDTLLFANGLSASDTYCSFYRASIELMKHDESVVTSYSVRGSACIFCSKDYRDESKPILDRVNVSVTLTQNQLESNMYGHLYEALKEKYESTSDDI